MGEDSAKMLIENVGPGNEESPWVVCENDKRGQ